jgi:hypothetical protein
MNARVAREGRYVRGRMGQLAHTTLSVYAQAIQRQRVDEARRHEVPLRRWVRREPSRLKRYRGVPEGAVVKPAGPDSDDARDEHDTPHRAPFGPVSGFRRLEAQPRGVGRRGFRPCCLNRCPKR